MEEFTKKQQNDLKVLINFVRIYCRAQHEKQDKAKVEAEIPLIVKSSFRKGFSLCLCQDCAELVSYAMERLRKCPLEPKPSCKHCTIHCYRKDYRARIREIMAFSGKRSIMRGRLDLLWHYYF